MRIYVTRRFSFEASHQLHEAKLSPAENARRFGRCSRLHGHSYRLAVTVSATRLQDGMVMDFGALKRAVEGAVLDKLDHVHLNELRDLRGLPTAENLTRYIFRHLVPEIRRLTRGRARIERIRLDETENSFVELAR